MTVGYEAGRISLIVLKHFLRLLPTQVNYRLTHPAMSGLVKTTRQSWKVRKFSM